MCKRFHPSTRPYHLPHSTSPAIASRYNDDLFRGLVWQHLGPALSRWCLEMSKEMHLEREPHPPRSARGKRQCRPPATRASESTCVVLTRIASLARHTDRSSFWSR